MPVAIRRIEIQWFRGISDLAWCPSEGLNCLVGPGDSGKSTILDAIDLCLGARRTVQFSDSDFHRLDTSRPIQITITIGKLSDGLRSMETYGDYLRGFDAATGKISDEPARGLEVVLTVRLTVGTDLEPVWELISDRTAAESQSRNLAWKDRQLIAPLRIGAHSSHNFGWQRGSVLSRLTDEALTVSGALTAAARTARDSFGAAAEPQLQDTLKAVAATAKSLGVDLGPQPRALLDAHATSFSAGGISLHSHDGVPLRSLGVGSTRLLVAGLQQSATDRMPIVLVDEVEHGLEPHRLIRFLHAIGAKQTPSASQSFISTHSPVAVRELAASQLVIVRNFGPLGVECKNANGVGAEGAIRLYPDTVLARSIVVCEGATEIGFVRGLDLYRESLGYASICARGAALVDGAGGPDKVYGRARAFQELGYPVLILRDNDVPVPVHLEVPFSERGTVVTWEPGRCLEAELFHALPPVACLELVRLACEVHGDLVHQHLSTVSQNQTGAKEIWAEYEATSGLSPATRHLLAVASTRHVGWFKQLGVMEDAARQVIGPAVLQSEPRFAQRIESLFTWIAAHGG